MIVADTNTDSVRAYLRGDMDAYRSLSSSFDKQAKQVNLALVTAFFVLASQRRFSGGDADQDIIDFVAAVRLRDSDIADAVDPVVAERLLRATVTDDEIDDIDGPSQAPLYWMLSVAMASELPHSDQLDLLLEESRKMADGWLKEM